MRSISMFTFWGITFINTLFPAALLTHFLCIWPQFVSVWAFIMWTFKIEIMTTRFKHYFSLRNLKLCFIALSTIPFDIVRFICMLALSCIGSINASCPTAFLAHIISITSYLSPILGGLVWTVKNLITLIRFKLFV